MVHVPTKYSRSPFVATKSAPPARRSAEREGRVNTKSNKQAVVAAERDADTGFSEVIVVTTIPPG